MESICLFFPQVVSLMQVCHHSYSMKVFLVGIFLSYISFNALSQLSHADSVRYNDSSCKPQASLIKAEAKNVLLDSVKEGKWFEHIDTNGNITSNPNAPFYSLTFYRHSKPSGMERTYYKDGKKDRMKSLL